MQADNDPCCPICGFHGLRIDEQDDDVYAWYALQVSCRRCETEFTARYQFYSQDDITLQRPYGPEYLTRDAQHALLALEGHAGAWQTIRTNGRHFVIGYEPWLWLQGYDRQTGWAQCTDDISFILAQGG